MRHRKSHNLRQCHDVRQFNCTQTDCDYTTDQKGNLFTHLKIHSNERPFVCDTNGCGMKFKRNNELKRHKLTHYHTLRVCHYEGCHKTFNDIYKLKLHINKIHLQITRRYSCEWPECEFTTDSYDRYYKYQKYHRIN